MSNLKPGDKILQDKILVRYDGKTFGPYPNEQGILTIEIVQRELAKQFPEAAKCEIGQKLLDDGSLELTFTKKAGTKGLSGADLAEMLRPVPPAEVEAVRFCIMVQQGDWQALLREREALMAAIEQLDGELAMADGMARRCAALRPVAGIAPAGL